MTRPNGRFLAGWLLVSFLVAAAPALAHNGAVALAVPVQGITIDGDFSDWPEDMRRYPVALPEYGARPRDRADLEVSFRVGYSAQENALYLAVEVRDESLVVATGKSPSAAWEASDGCEVYLLAPHRDGSTSCRQYALWGDTLQVFGGADPEQVRMAVHRQAGTHQYEWRLDLAALGSGALQGSTGTVLGLDVVVCDADQDGSSSWVAWGRGTSKADTPARTGDVVLLAASAGTGILRVQGLREDGAGPAAASRLRVRFGDGAAPWVDLATDRQGLAAAELPAGPYRVVPLSLRADPGAGHAASLEAQGTTAVDLVLPPVRGVTVPAGPGRTEKAGSGTRLGPWLTYDASDGLPGGAVSAICPDGRGGLWLATPVFGSGVSHFDGMRFRTFTPEDGLPAGEVSSLVLDPQGNLWIASWFEAASRYDGRSLTTFTAEEGLEGRYLRTVYADRQGRLWFVYGDGDVFWYDGQVFSSFDALLSSAVEAILEDSHGSLWFGTWNNGVARYDGHAWTSFTTADGLAGSSVTDIAEDRQGNLWFTTTSNGASRFDGRRFTTYTTADGLVADELQCVAADEEGGVWFGSQTGGVSHWDGQRFSTFTPRDGLTPGRVRAIAADGHGGMWFGTDGGLSRYDGAWIASFTAADGLAEDQAVQLLEDRQGNLWFQGSRAVSRYDGFRFSVFTAGRELPGRLVTSMGLDAQGRAWVNTIMPVNYVSRFDGQRWVTHVLEDDRVVSSILGDRQGNVWFATYGGGLSRFDGKQVRAIRLGKSVDAATAVQVRSLVEARDGSLWLGTEGGGAWRYADGEFTQYTTGSGLPSDSVYVIYQDRRDALWCGTRQGLCRMSPAKLGALTSEDSLAGNRVNDIIETQQGDLWIATDKGVVRYDGRSYTRYTTAEGLVHNEVVGVLEDREGDIWLRTSGGVSRFDGRVFQRLRRQDGLAHNAVQDMLQDRSGDLWFTTLAGVTRYRSRSQPPRVEITDVVADRRYGPVPEIRLPPTQQLLAFEFQGASLSTGPGQMIYLYRLEGHDPDWRVTREPRAEYAGLPVGSYTFEVKAVDRDLNYSVEPARVSITVHPPYDRIALAGGLALALAGMGIAAALAVQRRRSQRRAEHALMQELEQELQTAHDLQMGLMPSASPRITGLTIAGRCLPANHVGGDFYQYFRLPEDRLAICMADVTGHAMEAAIPAVMLDGILDSQMRLGTDPEDLFYRLNRVLYEKLTSRTHVAFSMLQLDGVAREFQFANAGCPYPCRYRYATHQVIELSLDAYPLGVKPDTVYRKIEARLEPGDYLVFYSDGIVEAVNGADELFGFERTTETVREACAQGLSPEGVIDHLVAAVRGFCGETAQGDDITCVVVRMEG